MSTKETSKKEYIARINRVMDYIDANIDQPISLDTIAQVAHFSLWHFHRIFTFLTGETPSTYIQRIRIEKAAYKLMRHDDQTISDIAHECGFSSISIFSRTFKKYYGVSAKEFRGGEMPLFNVGGLYYSKNGKLVSKNSQLDCDSDAQLCSVKLKQLIFMDTKVEVKEMPEAKVIYCRHYGEFAEIYKAYEKLVSWAGPRGLLLNSGGKSYTVYHDDPSVTSLDKVRQDACIPVTEDVKVEGEIGKWTIPGGKYAVGHFEIDPTEFPKAWNTMCSWFTESGYQQGDGCTYEYYHNDHTQHPEGKFIVDICIPVKPL